MEPHPSILIVDDERQIRSLLSATFTRAGFQVTTASSGRDAVECCSGRPFDVVLSDVRMPEMDGHELVSWIAVHRPQTRTVLMSGYDAKQVDGVSTSQCLLIAKPFKPSDVVDAVNHALVA